MTEHSIGTREEWLAARKALLADEKKLTRQADELAQRRRDLPWVPVEKEYAFETEDGTKTLAELFEGRSQLLVFHLMMGPDWEEPCVGCSYSADHLDGSVAHLNAHDVTLVGMSRAPLESMAAYKRRIGWHFPWISSLGSDFNFDFGASYTEEQQRNGAEYNFAPIDHPNAEEHGLTSFALDDGVVYHTYSAYHRGTDALNPTWQLLDRAPRGREGEKHPDWPQRSDSYGERAGLQVRG